jgi:membrane-associated phospholipid phosphatase
MTLAGSPELWLGMAAALVVFYFFRRNSANPKPLFRAFTVVFVVSLLASLGIVQAGKLAFHVERPCGEDNPYCENDFSFPSGHAASVFVFFTSVLIFVRRAWPAGILAAAVAWSRVALGVHTIADVAAGSVVGVVVSLVVWKALERGGKI